MLTVDGHVERTVHTFWYADRAIHAPYGPYLMYGLCGPYIIWITGNIWTPALDPKWGSGGRSCPPVVFVFAATLRANKFMLRASGQGHVQLLDDQGLRRDRAIITDYMAFVRNYRVIIGILPSLKEL